MAFAVAFLASIESHCLESRRGASGGDNECDSGLTGALGLLTGDANLITYYSTVRRTAKL